MGSLYVKTTTGNGPIPNRSELEGAWKTSLRLDSRRSLGEQELCALNNRPILPPHDEAFRPDPESIRWRYERIYQE